MTPALLLREQPRYRMADLGAQALSSAELLAILLSGVPADDALDVARQILASVDGSLRRLGALPTPPIDIPRLGPVSALRITAALELGRRVAMEAHVDGEPLRSPRNVVEVMAPRLEDAPVEEFHVLVLDSQHKLERDVLVTRGILNSSLVHPREVFRQAIAEKAAAVILCHNHPSGDPTPSADDRVVTEQLVAAGRLLDIPVHDHVIIGRGRYTSFAEAGLL